MSGNRGGGLSPILTPLAENKTTSKQDFTEDTLWLHERAAQKGVCPVMQR